MLGTGEEGDGRAEGEVGEVDEVRGGHGEGIDDSKWTLLCIIPWCTVHITVLYLFCLAGFACKKKCKSTYIVLIFAAFKGHFPLEL